jgi:hypothetical protein
MPGAKFVNYVIILRTEPNTGKILTTKNTKGLNSYDGVFNREV